MIPDETTDRLVRERLLSLCGRAVDTSLSLTDLVAELPDEYHWDEYYTVVRDDLVDGVEHVPATFWRKTTDYESWKRTEMHGALVLHVVLLGSRSSTPVLLAIYREIHPCLPADADRVRRTAESRLQNEHGASTVDRSSRGTPTDP